MTAAWQQELKQALANNHEAGLSTHPQFDAGAAKLFDPVITDTLLQAIAEADAPEALWQQFLPTKAEHHLKAGFVADPVGDTEATQVPGLIHKYRGRVLLIASGSCAVNCRYCFRRHFPYSQSFAPRQGWQASVAYIRQHTSIHEVILSGGDPLTLSTSQLQRLTDQLATIEHVKTLRIHSRIPVVMPSRIDATFMTWVTSLPWQRVLVLHVNHADELTAASQGVIRELQQSGFVLLNQSVLLRGINDCVDTLMRLSRDLFALGVLPYYLHQFDAVQNAAHFAVPESESINLHQQLQAHLPGYLVPKLVKEVAGTPHKTPLIEKF